MTRDEGPGRWTKGETAFLPPSPVGFLGQKKRGHQDHKP